MSASRRCASGIASEYLPARLSSAISALRAAASFFARKQASSG
jgi:hypothetical protein